MQADQEIQRALIILIETKLKYYNIYLKLKSPFHAAFYSKN